MRNPRVLAAVGFLVAVSVAFATVWWNSRRNRPQVGVASPTASRQYVGPTTCAGCHADKAALHARSGHARTFYASRDAAIARRMDGKRFRDPERGYEFHYRFGPEGLSVAIPEKLGEKEFPLEFVVGSGTHAVNFLTLVPNRRGEITGLEHRMTAFGSEEHWALTPGQKGQIPQQEIEHFGVVIPAGEELERCIGCHTTTARIVDRQVTDLIPHVTCESCHGPGDRHVAAMSSGKGDGNLEIEARWTAQQQLEMCGQCHRRTDWLKEPPRKTDFKIVRFQPVGLSQSKCYTKSAGKLSCTTCHDPHASASQDRPAYDQMCLKCHAPATASQVPCPVSPREKCVECHMPRIEIHKDFVVSDHWIRVRNAADLPAAPPREPAGKK